MFTMYLAYYMRGNRYIRGERLVMKEEAASQFFSREGAQEAIAFFAQKNNYSPDDFIVVSAWEPNE